MVIASKNRHELVDDENMASVIEGDVEFVLFDRSKYTDFIQNGLIFDSLGSYLLTCPSTNEYMGSISAVGNKMRFSEKLVRSINLLNEILKSPWITAIGLARMLWLYGSRGSFHFLRYF